MQPLSPIEHNGPGLEYRVSYRKAGVDDDWREHLVRRHSFVVRNTSTFTPYEIKIQSRNSHGWGPEPKTVSGYSGEDGEWGEGKGEGTETPILHLLHSQTSTLVWLCPHSAVFWHCLRKNVSG